MFPGFTSFDLEVETNVTIHGVKAGTGPPLLLLHGFPQSHIMWHLTAPQLSTSHTVIAMDLRGYGASSKLPVSASHAAYAKSAMARDCVAVMSHFNFPTFSVLAHDRGARVAHKLAVDHPTCVVKVMLLDIAPTLAMYEQTSQGFATAYFHWFFLIQANPFPENAILQAGDAWARMAVGKPPYGEANVSYVESFKDEATVTGWCEDYRAGATIDLEEAREDIRRRRKVKAPLRVLWGGKGIIGKFFDPLKEWKAVSEGDVSGEEVPSGHSIAEEIPDIVLKQAKEFFV